MLRLILWSTVLVIEMLTTVVMAYNHNPLCIVLLILVYITLLVVGWLIRDVVGRDKGGK